MKFSFSCIQQLGRALMLPIAVLPAAALLLCFGQADLLNLPFMTAADAAIFENLGLLFAIGIAVGFAKQNSGAAGLAGVVGYFVIIKGSSVLLAIPPEIVDDNVAKVAFLAQAASRMSIPVGIVAGLSAGLLYNRFLRDDPTAGAFMAGFFPVMMFSLPAACLAMYRNSLPANRRAVGGLLLSMALTAFLTGITEPIEFAFMFLAPVLYAVHAVPTGLSMVLMNMLDVKLGFGFSAGFIDYIINFNKAANPLYLIPIGAVYFAVYYLLFSFTIRFFKLKTMGREDISDTALPDSGVATAGAEAVSTATGSTATMVGTTTLTLGSAATSVQEMIAALGGAENILSVDACATRLRLTMKDNSSAVDQDVLKRLGAFGFSRPEAGSLQVVFGPTAGFVAAEVNRALSLAPFSEDSTVESLQKNTDAAQAHRSIKDVQGDDKIRDMITTLGGPENLKSVDACATRLRLCATRLRLVVDDNRIIDEAALKRLGALGTVRPDEHSPQVILGPVADTTATEITEMLDEFYKRP